MPLTHTVHEIKLTNGAKGLLIDIPGTTVVTYDFHFRAGNYFAPSPEVQQAAHIMEHMAFAATKNYPTVEQFSQEFSKNGAYNNASTSQYGMGYEADCALMEWDRILDLQRQAITEPFFTQALLDAEKGSVTEELTGQASNYGRVLYQQLDRAMGGISFLDTEKLQTIPRVTLDDIIAHHTRTHTAKNLRFCIAGNLGRHKEAIVQQLEAWDLPPGELLAIPQGRLHSARPVRVYRSDLPSIIFSLKIALNRRLTDEEAVALSALNKILTGTMHSRIWGKARVRGICYSVGSGHATSEDATTQWEISGQVRPQNAPELFTLVAEELKKVSEGGVTQSELEEAQMSAIGAYEMRGQTVSAIANWYAGYYFETAKIDLLQDSPKRIKHTKRSMLARIMKELLEEGQWAVGAIGNLEEPALEQLQAIVAPIFGKKS